MLKRTSELALKFTKMQGAGNDFVVFDNREYGLLLDEIISITPRLCHRRFGVGADGVLVLQPVDKADYRMIYRNADGSDAGMCGNGARCLASFAVRAGFERKLNFLVHGLNYKATVEEGEEFVHVEFPIDTVAGEPLNFFGRESLYVYSGTEHVVSWTEPELLENEDLLREQGSEIRYLKELFPRGTNVNFIHAESEEGPIIMKTYERGVEDLTLACGTGALASAVSHHSKTSRKSTGRYSYDVHCSGGLLKTSFAYDAESGLYNHLSLSGPVAFVFDGIYHITP